MIARMPNGISRVALALLPETPLSQLVVGDELLRELG